MRLAEELFRFWDVKGLGKIALQDIVKGFLSLGICRRPEFALRLVQMTKKLQ